MVKESSDLPRLRQRSKQVKPLSELQIQPPEAWRSDAAKWIGDTKWISDGHSLIDLSAADKTGTTAAARYLPAAEKKYPGNVIETVPNIEKEAKVLAEFLGYFHAESNQTPDVAYFGSKDGKTAVLGAHKLKMVESIIGKDYGAKMSDALHPVAFYKNGKIAAVVMPISGVDGIEHSTARETLKHYETAAAREPRGSNPRGISTRGDERKKGDLYAQTKLQTTMQEPQAPGKPQELVQFEAECKGNLVFVDLCRARGCHETELCELLFAVSRLSLDLSQRKQAKKGSPQKSQTKKALDSVPGIIPNNEMEKLPRDLKDIAQRIENANKPCIPLFPALAGTKRRIGIYAALPDILRDFADDLRALFGAYRDASSGFRHPSDLALLMLLHYVNPPTGDPDYQTVVELLQWAFNVTAARTRLGSPPAMLGRFRSADALRKFYDRAPALLKAYVASRL